MSEYRANGKTVEMLYRGEWVVVYYCTTSEVAQDRLRKCIERSKQPFDPLSILREQPTAHEGKETT